MKVMFKKMKRMKGCAIFLMANYPNQDQVTLTEIQIAAHHVLTLRRGDREFQETNDWRVKVSVGRDEVKIKALSTE